MAKKFKFYPCNDLLLCEKVTVDENVGSIILADPDQWQKRAKVIVSSVKLNPFVDDYSEGDIFIYHLGAPVFNLRIDDKDFIIIKKQDVVMKIKEEDV